MLWYLCSWDSFLSVSVYVFVCCLVNISMNNFGTSSFFWGHVSILKMWQKNEGSSFCENFACGNSLLVPIEVIFFVLNWQMWTLNVGLFWIDCLLWVDIDLLEDTQNFYVWGVDESRNLDLFVSLFLLFYISNVRYRPFFHWNVII